ncbi:MAG: ROK family protein [Patescibacteria group bacterium]
MSSQAVKNKLVLGIDIGGTKIASGLVNSRGQFFNLHKRSTPRQSRAQALSAIYKIIESYPRPKAIGLGITGRVDHKKGISVYSAHLPKNWKNVPLKKLIEDRYNIPTTINNDAKCFAVAENIYGAGKKYNNYIAATWGTGVGGAIILNNKIFSGHTNTAGEIGHFRISQSSDQCRCGQTGHWEALTAGLALKRMYQELSGKNLDNKEIIRLWKKGDKKASQVVLDIASVFGIGLASLANILNPEAIIVGGGLATVPGLLTIAKSSFKEHVYTPAIGNIPVIKAGLGEYANIVGAAYIAGHKDY